MPFSSSFPLVQSNHGIGADNLSYLGDNTSGNVLVAFFAMYTNFHNPVVLPTSVTSANGNTWQLVCDNAFDADSEGVQMWVCLGCNAGAETLTFNGFVPFPPSPELNGGPSIILAEFGVPAAYQMFAQGAIDGGFNRVSNAGCAFFATSLSGLSTGNVDIQFTASSFANGGNSVGAVLLNQFSDVLVLCGFYQAEAGVPPDWAVSPAGAEIVAFTVETPGGPNQHSALFGFLAAPYAGSSLAISCNNPPGGYVGFPYSHLLGASGGTPPYTFAITAGALPPGLALTAANGLIAGTPTAAGSYSFTVQVTDADAATASVVCSIVISAMRPGGGGVHHGGGTSTPPGGNMTGPGVQLTKNASAILGRAEACQQWPYWWVYPPPGAIPVQQIATLAGTDGAGGGAFMVFLGSGLTSYQVPNGYRFRLAGVVFDYADATPTTPGAVPARGDFLWSLTVNKSQLAGNAGLGNSLPGFTALDVFLGNLTDAGPWPIPAAALGFSVFEPGDALRFPLSAVVMSAQAGYFSAGLFGWLVDANVAVGI
jgi:hypothetical protein